MQGIFPKRTVAVSSGSSAAPTRGVAITPATPAAASPVIKRRLAIIAIYDFSRPSGSRLQLMFDLVQKAPVRAIGNDLLRRALDRAEIVQP